MRQNNLSLFIILKALFVIFLVSSNAYAADIKKNHLEPDSPIFIGVNFITNYHLRIVDTFSKAYEGKSDTDEVKIRAIVNPSFSPEYVVGVRQEGDKYIAFKLKAEKQIWSEYHDVINKKNIDIKPSIKINVIESECMISEQTYKILAQAWQGMISRTKYSDNMVSGLDGISYHFSTNRLIAGRTWSPDPNSQTGYLVKLTELLGKLTESKDTKIIEDNIKQTATTLINSLGHNQ